MQAITSGIHHLGLTVPDIDATRAFFVDALGFRQVGQKPDYPAVFVSDGSVMLTLWQAKDPSRATPFDRHHSVGLHHVALRVADAASLEALHQRLLTRNDVALEFAPEPLGKSQARHLMCSIPGGVRVEFIAEG